MLLEAKLSPMNPLQFRQWSGGGRKSEGEEAEASRLFKKEGSATA